VRGRQGRGTCGRGLRPVVSADRRARRRARAISMFSQGRHSPPLRPGPAEAPGSGRARKTRR
jgi:hypothetical protein